MDRTGGLQVLQDDRVYGIGAAGSQRITARVRMTRIASTVRDAQGCFPMGITILEMTESDVSTTKARMKIARKKRKNSRMRSGQPRRSSSWVMASPSS
ncbi:MAG: hypothetical protein KIS29_11390 [Thermoplasmata archaeon]|nr:hypothetical protein [Candidatus Sysuiplasma jiujiangense]